MGEVADSTLTKPKKKKGRPSLLDLQKRALKQQQLLIHPKTNDRIRSNPDSDDDDERRDKKHRLLSDDAGISRRNKGQKVSQETDILQRTLVEESGPFTPLPDKKLLLFVLDRVQKKDTYGVYSDPVDTDELPDYLEIIKNPMDFGTLRKKLDSGVYATLEQFEEDVLLICTNAMEYNPADTVYHRQARAMLEIAKKDFGNLRQESDEEEPVSLSQQPKVAKRGRPPGSGLKKHTEPSSIDRTTSEVSADGDISRFSGAYNLRKTPPSYKINHNNENQSGFLIDWEKEFPLSVVKAVNKYGMKNADETKRDTYYEISTSFQEVSIFSTLNDDLKQLTPVGLKTEYGYARSLARYAANLGPVAWRFANKRIKTVLPTGIEFGPGWVGENPEAPPLMSVKQKCFNDLASDESIRSESAPAAPLLKKETENNDLSGSNQMQGLLPRVKQEFNQCPPDLNAKVVSPNSPVSNLQVGNRIWHYSSNSLILKAFTGRKKQKKRRGM